MRRKVTERLLRWRWTSTKALLVTGARQADKSYAIREFGKANYTIYHETNLLLGVDTRETLTGARNAGDFILRVIVLSERTLVEVYTLIFVDEVQEYPEIVTLVKGLVEDGRFSFVL